MYSSQCSWIIVSWYYIRFAWLNFKKLYINLESELLIKHWEVKGWGGISCWPHWNKFVCFSSLLPLLDSRQRPVPPFRRSPSRKSNKISVQSFTWRASPPFCFSLIFSNSRDGLRQKQGNGRCLSEFWQTVFLSSCTETYARWRDKRFHLATQIKPVIFHSVCRVLIASERHCCSSDLVFFVVTPYFDTSCTADSIERNQSPIQPQQTQRAKR